MATFDPTKGIVKKPIDFGQMSDDTGNLKY
jgi:hypothetical protein